MSRNVSGVGAVVSRVSSVGDVVSAGDVACNNMLAVRHAKVYSYCLHVILSPEPSGGALQPLSQDNMLRVVCALEEQIILILVFQNKILVDDILVGSNHVIPNCELYVGVEADRFGINHNTNIDPNNIIVETFTYLNKISISRQFIGARFACV